MKRGSKIRLILFIIILIIVTILCFYESEQLNNDCDVCTGGFITVEAEQITKQVVVIKEEPVKVVQAEEIHETVQITEDDYLLAKIAMAEAEGESTKGKALVILVVLNRLKDNSFPDTVEEVIYQHNGDIYQFSPVANGRFDNVEPNEDCWKALEMVNDGWDESQGALYFESCKGETWHTRNLELLFEEGGHQFYK